MATKAAEKRGTKELENSGTRELKTVKAKVEKKVSTKKVAVKEHKEPKTQKLKTVKAKAVKKTVKAVEAGSPKTDVKVKEVKVEKKKPGSVLEELFEAGAHFGHVVKKWNPKMKRFIWGAKNGIHIFDLEKTVAGLESATKILTELSTSGKRVILVGTKRQVRQMIEVEARRLDIPFISQRWIGGLITNWKQVKQTVDRLNSQKLLRESGQLKKYTKKEQVMFDKEIARLERNIGGIAALKEAPEVVVVFDTHKEKLAVKEASSRGITVVGIVDSNANPDLVDYPIPMNDDSAKGLEIVVRTLGQAIETGLKKLKESKNQNEEKK